MLKKWIWALLLPVFLTGCQAETVPQWETVDDELVEVIEVIQEPYAMTFGIPDDAVLEVFASSDTRKVYLQENGDYEITSEALRADSIADVVQELTGFSMEDLTVMQTLRGSLPEYQFAWTSNTGSGGIVSRATVLDDGGYFYALVFSVQESCGDQYQDCAQSVFSSFGIYADEQF